MHPRDLRANSKKSNATARTSEKAVEAASTVTVTVTTVSREALAAFALSHPDWHALEPPASPSEVTICRSLILEIPKN